ncbi:MAG: hypothetical protein J6Q14_08260 [Oscillospiraceae bacterium]|nr:hypothetical protein [Oscillospiraceae bacterium]
MTNGEISFAESMLRVLDETCRADSISFVARRGLEVIEALRRDLKDCRNELCLRCGNYKLAHKGACDGCRWKDMGD